MANFDENLEVVARAFKNAIAATDDFDRAFDAAVAQYCAKNGCRDGVEANVDVGLLLAELQARSLRRGAEEDAAPAALLVPASQ